MPGACHSHDGHNASDILHTLRNRNLQLAARAWDSDALRVEMAAPAVWAKIMPTPNPDGSVAHFSPGIASWTLAKTG